MNTSKARLWACAGVVILAALAACSDDANNPRTVVDTTAIADPLPPPPEPELVPEPEPVVEAVDPSNGWMSPHFAGFNEHTVQVYSGARVPPVLTEENRSYRTRINETSTWPVDFAGNKVITTFGCGGGCQSGYIVDVETGAVTPLGLGGEDQMYMQLNYRADSNLLVASWEQSSDSGYGWTCFYQRYLWNGQTLAPMGTTNAVNRPDIGMCLSDS